MTVTGCDDCPLWQSEYGDCGHPEGGERSVNVMVPGAPDWCPLRTAPLTIALEGCEERPCPACGSRQVSRDESGMVCVQCDHGWPA